MAINLFGNPNMKPTTGKTTMPAQPSIQPAMKPAPSPLTGTGTPWQRGTRGMDRVKMPGVNSYAPQRPATPPVTGVQSLSRPAQVSPGQNPASPFLPGGMFSTKQPSGYDQFKANMPQMGGAPQQPAGFGGVGVAPTGDTSTWDANDWYRYNQFQQQNPLAAALSNYGG